MEKSIYHVCTSSSWDAQVEKPFYLHPSLTEEGFIHCSKEAQISGVLDRYFKGQENLLILTIDPTRLISSCIEEQATGGEFFPHIYGVIQKEAIVEITPLIQR